MRQYTKDEITQYRFLSESIYSAKLGVAFSKKGDQQIADKLTKVLRKMVADRTVSRIVEKYSMNGIQAVKDLE